MDHITKRILPHIHTDQKNAEKENLRVKRDMICHQITALQGLIVYLEYQVAPLIPEILKLRVPLIVKGIEYGRLLCARAESHRSAKLRKLRRE